MSYLLSLYLFNLIDSTPLVKHSSWQKMCLITHLIYKETYYFVFIFQNVLENRDLYEDVPSLK